MGHRLGITMGDPSGVGPEVTVKALAGTGAEERNRIVVLGCRSTLERAARIAGVPSPEVAVIDVATPDSDTIRDGCESTGGGHAAYGYVRRAVELALAGEIEVIVTAPLNKAALHLAGHRFDGHTEILQHLTDAPSSIMLLASERLSTIHVSTHVSLAGAVQRCRAPRVLEIIEAADRHFRRLGTERPRVAVAGLNPHSGEGGLFGREDEEQIRPAVEAACARGIDASGPWPGDSVFLRATRGEFDVVVAQYHDQGHIPTKLVAFESAVNVTLGLPIQRTSVDHGTAFDIAWQGCADPRNMLAAIAYANRLADTE
ncbi:MAG: 4-hydroxythreonine-4-phosphate dehydrogenase PdxA [Immundisolibacterales bacterium]|nr:4-hydroxythreonine-4-phosphate dehydrogenase PdxA [Immundisolibacterales bacterium]